jgi:catechol 2,3-dioxygenase-like lactoylglutathione lyase family enzyme
MNIEKISAVTLKVRNMHASVKFYKDILGFKMLYGGENATFSSFLTAEDQYLNLEEGESATGWGRIIFYVDDVDVLYNHLKANGFCPGNPADASWGERYFHVLDPEGHELSFARSLQDVVD